MFSRIMAAKSAKKIVFVRDSVVQNILEMEGNYNMKTESESYVLDLGNGISRG